LGSFTSSVTSIMTTQVTSPAHPVMLGSTASSLAYTAPGRATVAVPADFEVLAIQPHAPPLPLVAARDVACAP
jgi:hypothetical protein